MLGEDFMVAPALFYNTVSREMYLPEGGLVFIAEAPMGEPPVYYRADSKYADQVVENLVASGVINQ